MKTKVLLTTVLMILLSAGIYAQNSYQIFSVDGFKVKSGCELDVNTTFLEMAEQQGINNILASYICGENTDNPSLGVINNINIYDESKNYKDLQPSAYANFEKKYLEQYASNLDNAGISYEYSTYQGVQAIEYSFSPQGLPSKAIVFLKGKKSYLLQVGTRQNLSAKYNSLKSSFRIL